VQQELDTQKRGKLRTKCLKLRQVKWKSRKFADQLNWMKKYTAEGNKDVNE
jgi:hypothetical protein